MREQRLSLGACLPSFPQERGRREAPGGGRAYALSAATAASISAGVFTAVAVASGAIRLASPVRAVEHGKPFKMHGSGRQRRCPSVKEY